MVDATMSLAMRVAVMLCFNPHPPLMVDATRTAIPLPDSINRFQSPSTVDGGCNVNQPEALGKRGQVSIPIHR